MATGFYRIGSQPPPTTNNATVDELLKQASDAYDAAQKALAAKDLGEYQKQINQLGDILTRLDDARAAETGTGKSSSSSTTTTTRPAGKSGTQALGRPAAR